MGEDIYTVTRAGRTIGFAETLDEAMVMARATADATSTSLEAYSIERPDWQCCLRWRASRLASRDEPNAAERWARVADAERPIYRDAQGCHAFTSVNSYVDAGARGIVDDLWMIADPGALEETPDGRAREIGERVAVALAVLAFGPGFAAPTSGEPVRPPAGG